MIKSEDEFMDHLKKSKLFYALVLLIGFLVTGLLIREYEGLLSAFQIIINTLLVPTVISVFIYYLVRPLYNFLMRTVKKESLSILIVFLVIFIFLGLLILRFVPTLLTQIDSFLQSIPQLITEIDEILTQFNVTNTEDINYYLDIVNYSIEDLVEGIIVGLRSSTNFVFGFISSSFLIVSIVPFMLFYMLKNTNKEKKMLFVPEKYRELAVNYFIDSERVLSNYISGKAMVCLYVFAGAFVCFSFAGLPGAFLFAAIAGVMDIVPYFGPWIGALPAVLSGLVNEGTSIWIIIIGIIIVQMGESFIVSPLVMSKELKLSPLLIIIVMLLTGQIFGLLGMVIALPMIALIKVTFDYARKLYQMQKEELAEE